MKSFYCSLILRYLQPIIKYIVAADYNNINYIKGNDLFDIQKKMEYAPLFLMALLVCAANFAPMIKIVPESKNVVQTAVDILAWILHQVFVKSISLTKYRMNKGIFPCV